VPGTFFECCSLPLLGSLRKAPYILSSVKLSDFTVWRHTWRKNWVNCAVLTRNSSGLRTVLSSRLSHRVLRSSHREFNSFLILPADTTMASSQGTSVPSKSCSRWASHDIFLFKYHFLLHLVRFLSFSDNIVADLASKQQTTALFLSTIVTRIRRHTTDKRERERERERNLMRHLCCAWEYTVQFFVQFFFYF
jgi:hypothetical protein